MFLNISWTNYVTFVSLLLAVWYMAIAFKFYFSNLKNLFANNTKISLKRGNKKSSFNNEPIKTTQLSDVKDNILINPEETDQLFKAAEELKGKLKNAISSAALKRQNEHEIRLLLQLIVSDYQILKNSLFQTGINDLIVEEYEKYGFIALSAGELMMLWNKVK